jgi:uncharacterized membrane protein
MSKGEDIPGQNREITYASATPQTAPPAPDACLPRTFALSDIGYALSTGFVTFRAIPGPSIGLASLFAFIGLALLAVIGRWGFSPMALPVAGGFLLVGPALLTGFFRLAAMADDGDQPQLSDAFDAFRRAPAGLWLVASICSFLFLIWITDAAVLYAMMVGGAPLPYELPWVIRLQRNVVAFELWGSLMGSVLAVVIYFVSAFSVPLLHEGRAGIVLAVSASVRAVTGSPLASICWGLFLAGAMLLSILLLPLFVVALPVLAYASFALYRRVFPRAAPGID